VRAHRRETSIGFGIALLLVAVYHSFAVMAQAWDTRPERHPELLLWVPNFLFNGLGAVLLWRVNRRG
jgi:lipopolysaccharide export system permease protein